MYCVAYLDGGPRVGRSQGASIFWGLVSVFFAAAACFYYWKNHENEINAAQLRDEVVNQRDQIDMLTSEKEKLQASKSEADAELKTRADFLQEKETKLAEEESRLDALGQQSLNQTQQSQGQAAVMKKFNDVIHKLGKDEASDVVERGGRSVLRVPNAVLFAPGDATLKPDGKTLLNQVAQALNGQLVNFELRVVSYTDTDAEVDKPAADAKPDTAPKPHYATSWELTAARANAIALFCRDLTTLPFGNVLVIGRGDSEPIVPNSKDGHARNRRIEITVVPLPAPFHLPDPAHANAGSHSTAPVNPLEPPPDPPASTNKGN